MAQKYGNRWTIIESISEGGQGIIYKVKDSHNNSTEWVLKRLKNPNRLGRFEREIAVLEKLDCPHIPKPVDYSTKGKAFIVFPDLGVDLSRFATTTELDTQQILLLFRQVVVAVCAAHNVGVIHRDIKPNNIIISEDRNTAFLIDFGICQYIDNSLTQLTSNEAFGNSGFAAPECLLGREEEPSFPCDIYSLGKLFYWIISNGKYINRERITPHIIKNIIAKNLLICFYLTRLVRGTVQENPDKRWNANHLLNEIDATLNLVNRELQFSKKGIVVIEDNFGVEDAFYRSGSKSTTKAPRGNPPGNYDIGIAFATSPDHNLKLDTISLALSKRSSAGKVEIKLVPDNDRQPDSTKILEVFCISVPNIQSVLTLNSSKNPILVKGKRYWIILSALGTGTEIAFWSAPIEFIPRSALIAKRTNHEDWKVAEAAPGYAFRVTGKPILFS